MSLKVNERVAVVAIFAGKKQPICPIRVRLQKSEYTLGKVDFYHTTKDGYHTVHHFSLCDVDQSMYMKLAFNSGTLVWTLEETEPCT